MAFESGKAKNQLGGGWVGSIKNTGFRGEFTFFTDLSQKTNVQAPNIVAALSADHLFQNGSYSMLEYLYNERRDGVENNLVFFIQPLKADNLSFTDHSLFAN